MPDFLEKKTAAGLIGVVGLGLVGTAIAHRLAAAGFQPLGFDIRPEARDAFSQSGYRVAESVPAMAQAAPCVVLAVFDTHDVISVVEGPDGLLAGGGRASALDRAILHSIVDCSTGAPDALQALAGRLQAHGVDLIEAPLSGSSQQIAAGEATMLLGANPDALARCAPVLDAISRQQIHVGGAGMGAKAKLATNLVLGLNRAALAEGMVFAETLGIDPAKFLQLVMQTPARSGAAEAKGQMMVDGNFIPQSRIRQHLKDVELMLASARERGQKLPLSETHATLMRSAIAAGDGELDNAAIIRQIRLEK
jgi:3-hydroxyisobutyrate dehydrogenase-like beta-hydroxyacid dehydrogenase